MLCGEKINDILCRWQNDDIRRREGFFSVWDVGWPGLFTRHRRQRREAITLCRRELMSSILGSQETIYLIHEAPRDWGVPGNWQPASQATWLVPPDFNPDNPAVQSWLSVGNWTFYSAPAPVEGNWPDPSRCRAADLLAWMRTKSVWALIDSFHDDTSWVVAFETGEPNTGKHC
jgi:hypothetical protein